MFTTSHSSCKAGSLGSVPYSLEGAHLTADFKLPRTGLGRQATNGPLAVTQRAQILKKEKLGRKPRLPFGISALTVLRTSEGLQPLCSGRFRVARKEGVGPVRSSQCLQGSQAHAVCQNRPRRYGHQAELMGGQEKPTGDNNPH